MPVTRRPSPPPEEALWASRQTWWVKTLMTLPATWIPGASSSHIPGVITVTCEAGSALARLRGKGLQQTSAQLSAKSPLFSESQFPHL